MSNAGGRIEHQPRADVDILCAVVSYEGDGARCAGNDGSGHSECAISSAVHPEVLPVAELLLIGFHREAGKLDQIAFRFLIENGAVDFIHHELIELVDYEFDVGRSSRERELTTFSDCTIRRVRHDHDRNSPAEFVGPFLLALHKEIEGWGFKVCANQERISQYGFDLLGHYDRGVRNCECHV